MRQIIFFIMLLLTYAVTAQDKEAIAWSEEPSWEAVKLRARQENKYIFVDCYATWCAPCKKMDKEVYTVDSVGNFFNERFISIKVQMDATAKDNAHVQGWRNDAQSIAQQYSITAFPSFLFFTPEGVLAEKTMGFQPARQFMIKSRAALTAGKLYKDPKDHYEDLLQRYAAGENLYDSIFYLFKTAVKFRDTATIRRIRQDLNKHLDSLTEEALFTASKIDYMQSITNTPKSRWFSLFYNHPKLINRAMKDHQYAERVVQQAILNNVAYPFINMKPPALMLSTGRIKADLAEADWEGLEQRLRKDFNTDYAKRVVLAARFTWYKQHWNLNAFMDAYYTYLDRYGIDTHTWTSTSQINSLSFSVAFKAIHDHKILNRAIHWMKKVIKQTPTPNMYIIDTYANLLYKVGKRKTALKWEELALQKAKLKDDKTNMSYYASIITKMKQGEKLGWWEN